MQDMRRSKRVAQHHYDLNTDFYERMLGPHMQYTCAYWKRAQNLAEAQEHKLDLICRKLQLKKGERVLELGCGWRICPLCCLQIWLFGGRLQFPNSKWRTRDAGVPDFPLKSCSRTIVKRVGIRQGRGHRYL
jgi:hypothetical protein